MSPAPGAAATRAVTDGRRVLLLVTNGRSVPSSLQSHYRGSKQGPRNEQGLTNRPRLGRGRRAGPWCLGGAGAPSACGCGRSRWAALRWTRRRLPARRPPLSAAPHSRVPSRTHPATPRAPLRPSARPVVWVAPLRPPKRRRRHPGTPSRWVPATPATCRAHPPAGTGEAAGSRRTWGPTERPQCRVAPTARSHLLIKLLTWFNIYGYLSCKGTEWGSAETRSLGRGVFTQLIASAHARQQGAGAAGPEPFQGLGWEPPTLI